MGMLAVTTLQSGGKAYRVPLRITSTNRLTGQGRRATRGSTWPQPTRAHWATVAIPQLENPSVRLRPPALDSRWRGRRTAPLQTNRHLAARLRGDGDPLG